MIRLQTLPRFGVLPCQLGKLFCMGKRFLGDGVGVFGADQFEVGDRGIPQGIVLDRCRAELPGCGLMRCDLRLEDRIRQVKLRNEAGDGRGSRSHGIRTKSAVE